MSTDEKRALSLAPGSAPAVAAGCKCPRAANNFGQGRQLAWGLSFVVVWHCSVHGHWVAKDQ